MRLAIILILSLTACSKPTPRKCSDSVVALIGGCNKYGECGVVLINGEYWKDVIQPVVGVQPYGPYCKLIN